MTSRACQFGDHEATNIKVEVDRVWNDETDREIKVKVRIPICKPCNEEHYDGTEDFPRLLPLV